MPMTPPLRTTQKGSLAESIGVFAADLLVDRRGEEEKKWMGGSAGDLGDKSGQCLLHIDLEIDPRRQEEQLQITITGGQMEGICNVGACKQAEADLGFLSTGVQS